MGLSRIIENFDSQIPGGLEKMNRMRLKLVVIAVTVALFASSALAADQSKTAEKIRKELVTLPYYGVFDNLAFKLQGNTVILYGQVVRPTSKSTAEKRVAKIEGVDHVVNNIEVLPLSSFDQRLRLRVYRAVFRTGSLYRYSLGANPSIHIVVKGGHVSLEGVVSNKSDSNLAYIAANGVPGVFSVTNNLRVER
jgi:hyperosmotically inducible protein